MIENLAEYFQPEQEFYLHKITYDRLERTMSKAEYDLNCVDNISVEICSENKIKIIVTRSLAFEPQEMFTLSVAFGTELKFNLDRVKEHNWNEINLAEEFRDYGSFVTANLMSRITLLIAQITSSFGQQPLVLPPVVTGMLRK